MCKLAASIVKRNIGLRYLGLIRLAACILHVLYTALAPPFLIAVVHVHRVLRYCFIFQAFLLVQIVCTYSD